MNLFRKLETRIVAGMALLISLMFAMAVLSAGEIRSLSRRVTQELTHLQQSADIESGLVASVFNEIRAADRYLSNPSASLKSDFVISGDAAYAYQRRLRELGSLTTEDRYMLNRLTNTQAEIEVAYGLAHALADLGRETEAQARVASVKELSDSLLGGIRSITSIQGRRALERAESLRTKADERQAIILILFLAALVAGAVVTFWTVREVNRPLQRLAGAADRFGAGDLRPVALGRMPTELERLGQAMSGMGDRLRTVVAAVIKESRQVSTSAGDFSAMSQELSSSSSEISTAMVKISRSAEGQMTAMREADALLHTLREAAAASARTAEQVVQLGEEIRSVAARHQSDVDAAGRTLLDVREVVRTSAEQVQQLAKLSESITDFIDLIKQISSQTNLLALNAAIEAARAGEHGRGFAVVAEEVRSLADSSARAAADVTQTVQFIRDQVREVSATMEIGTTKVRGIESVAQAASRGLQEIVQAVDEVQTAAGEVASAARETRGVVDQLGNRTVQASQTATEHAASSEQVTAAAEQLSASTEQMASAAAELLEGANRLGKMVAEFKT